MERWAGEVGVQDEGRATGGKRTGWGWVMKQKRGKGGEEARKLLLLASSRTGQRKASKAHAYDGMTALEVPCLAAMT